MHVYDFKFVRFMTLNNGSLIIHDMSQSDAGTYHCVGISHTGSTQTFSVELSLACKFQDLYIFGIKKSSSFWNL